MPPNGLACGGYIACVAGLPDGSRIEPFRRVISIHESALVGVHLSDDSVARAGLATMADEHVD